MCFRQTSLVFTIILCSVVSCWANGKIETRIGPFNLGSSPVTESKFISQFGEGYVQIDKVGNEILGKKHIYYSSDEKVWIEIFFSHVLDEKLEHILEAVLITKKKLCDESFEPKNTFGSLATSKGIRIGDSLEKVLRLYGKPTIDIEVGKDKSFSALVQDLKVQRGRILRYLSDRPRELFFAEFYFSEQGLHSLLFSQSE